MVENGFVEDSDDGLVQLIYVSAITRDLDVADLDSIAESSERNNAARGITGLLLYQAASFYAVLEGVRREVFERMERIITDSRHRDIQILRESSIQTRRFENWSFATIPPQMGGFGTRHVSYDFIRQLSRRLR